MKSSTELKKFATLMRSDLHQRLRCEAVRSKLTIQTIVDRALDRYIPRDIKITTGRTARRRDDADRKSDDTTAVS
jgi:hypothetical protein